MPGAISDSGSISSMPGRHGRFVFLDGLRGVAAIAVVLYHLGQLLGEPEVAPHGDIAVDFFFMLSGFVIAFAYERRIKSGQIGRVDLIKARVIRLLPMALAGLALGTVFYVASGLAAKGGNGTFTLYVILGAAMIGSPLKNPFRTNIMPINPPSWSLFYELYVGTVLTLIIPYLRTRILLAITLLSALIEVWAVHHYQSTNNGFIPGQMWAGFPRFIFCFCLGWSCSRLHDRIHLPSLPPALIALGLVVALFLPALGPHGLYINLGILLFYCPLILILGAACQVTGRVEKAADWSGRLSYPIYTLHFPIVMTFASVAHGKLAIAAAFVVIVVASYCALVLYDEPVRIWISRKLKRRAPHAALATVPMAPMAKAEI